MSPAASGSFIPSMKATRILFISGVLLLLAVLCSRRLHRSKLQSGSPGHGASERRFTSVVVGCVLDATYATPEFIKRVKLEPYLQQWQNRAQPFLIGINTHVGTIANLGLGGKVEVEASNGDRFLRSAHRWY
jgi:hypothetical protein